MTPTETKAALRNFVNSTIKGEPDEKAIHDLLQAKMQARIAKLTAPDGDNNETAPADGDE